MDELEIIVLNEINQIQEYSTYFLLHVKSRFKILGHESRRGTTSERNGTSGMGWGDKEE
jgi:hypothetical protein